MMDYIQMIRSKVGNEKIFLNCVGGAIFDENQRVLLQKRGDNNMWGFPGGTMELGESVTETLKREIAEETGLTVEAGKIIGIYSKYSDRYPNGDQSQPIVIFFECIVTGGELKRDGQETLDLKFFDKNNKPPLFNSQHEDMFHDLFDKSRTDCVIR